MNTEFIIKYNGKKVDTKHSAQLGNAIINLGLRKGDELQSHPFNYFNDEQTDTKSEVGIHQKGLIIISDIRYIFINTWNGKIKTKIIIELKPKRIVKW